MPDGSTLIAKGPNPGAKANRSCRSAAEFLTAKMTLGLLLGRPASMPKLARQDGTDAGREEADKLHKLIREELNQRIKNPGDRQRHCVAEPAGGHQHRARRSDRGRLWLGRGA